jgi:peptidyl-prolyl cis-trans isomerase SurA
MMRRNRFYQTLASIILAGAAFLSQLTFAQDSSKTLADSKIRNIDGVAAVVNTGYVTRKEIDDRIVALQKQGAKLPDAATLRKTVLERLILEKIQLQNADQEGIAVSDKELDKIISDIAAKNKLTLAELKVKIVATGSTY